MNLCLLVPGILQDLYNQIRSSLNCSLQFSSKVSRKLAEGISFFVLFSNSSANFGATTDRLLVFYYLPDLSSYFYILVRTEPVASYCLFPATAVPNFICFIILLTMIAQVSIHQSNKSIKIFLRQNAAPRASYFF